jgi:hypothetical protein
LLNFLASFRHDHEIIGIPDQSVALPQQGLHPIQGNVGQQWADYPTLRRSFRGPMKRAPFYVSRLEPLLYQFSSRHRTHAVLDKAVADVIEGTFDVGVQNPPIAARGGVIEGIEHLFDGILAASPWSETVAFGRVGIPRGLCLPLALGM